MRKRNWVLLVIAILLLASFIAVINLTATNQTLAYIKDDTRQVEMFEKIYPEIFEAEELKDIVITKDVTVYQNIINHTSYVQSHKEALDNTISQYTIAESAEPGTPAYTISTSFDIDKRLVTIRLANTYDLDTYKEYVYKLKKGSHNTIKYKLKRVGAAGH